MFFSGDSFSGPLSLELVSLRYRSLDNLSSRTPSNKVLYLRVLSLDVSLLIERLNNSSEGWSKVVYTQSETLLVAH